VFPLNPFALQHAALWLTSQPASQPACLPTDVLGRIAGSLGD